MLETIYLKFRKPRVQRVTVIKFGVYNGGGNCLCGVKVKVGMDTAESTNVMIAGFRQCIYLICKEDFHAVIVYSVIVVFATNISPYYPRICSSQDKQKTKVHSGSDPYVGPTATVATACDVLQVESLGTPASTVPATTVAAGCGVLEVEPSDTPASTVTNANEPTIVLAAFYGERKATKTMDPHGEATRCIRLSKRLRKVPSRFE